MDALNGTPLTAYGDYQVLAVLRRSNHPMQPSVLADVLQVTRPGITGRLQRLEQLSLVSRRPHPEDARRALIEITPKGVELVEQIFAAGQQTQNGAFAVLTHEERESLSNLLRKVLIGLLDTPSGA